MKILLIPDIHGREFWLEPCLEWEGQIIFLGDYHDPYPDQVSVEDSLTNLWKLTEFYKDNSDRCIMLLGNHDFSYVGTEITCRYDRKNHKEVTKLLEDLSLKVIHIQDNIIFSHAGVTQDWLGHNHINLYDLIKLPIDNSILSQIPYIRGGYAEYGSPIWEDLRLFNASHLPDNYYQIFGHTQLKENAYITDKFADLDCRKAFIVDTITKEIKEYEN